MSAAADRAQRQAADPALSVFVTANAGSGKTKVLVDRIARLLLEGAPPSAFLCITYTKAAAAEMQRRLFKQLGDWCVASDETLRANLNALEGRAPDAPLSEGTVAQARTLFAKALESPGGLKIQTIHAFCERLLARFPLEAGVAPGFDIADDARAREMLVESWSAVALSDDAAVRAALERFGARLADERFQALLGGLVNARREVGAFIAACGGVDEAVAAVARRHDADASAAEVARAALEAAPWRALGEAIATLEGCGAKTMGDLAARIRDAMAARTGEPLDAFAAYKDIFFTSQDKPRASLLTATLKKNEPALDRLFEDACKAVIEAYDAIRAAERAADAQAAVRLASALNARYAQVKTTRGVLDFADLIEHALALLTRGKAGAWVLYKLDGGLQHILIDEGQDTSPEQWALLAPLQDEFFAGAGAQAARRTVFAVGDPKQSIYSFQGAHPQAFLDQSQALASRAAAGGQGFAATPLETSFRSTPEVLTAVDETFSAETLGGDTPGLFDIVRHVAARAQEHGRVEWWPFAPRPILPPDNGWNAPQDITPPSSAQTKLAEAVALRAKAWIDAGEAVWERGHKRAMRAGDVLILVRARGPLFSQILMALKRVGLPVAGADRMLLKDELAVQDCLSLMRVAADPYDDLALACLMKSPFIGLSDDEQDLFPLAHGRRNERLHARLMAANDARYAGAQDFVRKLIERAGAGPFGVLSWALESADASGASGWTRMRGRLGEECRDPIEELLSRAVGAHQRGPATLDAFLADIETDEAEVKREMEEAGDCVRVMTVHGAKGLEAPVVILPDTTGPPRQQGDDTLFITPEGPVFSASSRDDDPYAAQVRVDWRRRQDEEHLRLLYVAMTRARDRLIVCGVGRGQGAGTADQNSWHTLVERAMARIGAEIETPFGTGRALGALETAAADAPAAALIARAPAWAYTQPAQPPHAHSAAPSTLMKEGSALSPRADGGLRFRRGLMIHGLLQRLPDIDAPLRRDAAKTWLRTQGVGAGEAEALAGEALGVIEDARFAHAFAPGSRGEQPIIGRVGLGRGGETTVRGIVDRLVVGAETIDVIDFKSDRPSPEDPADAPEGYVLQMALYRAVLGQIFPNRTIRCALIWTEKPILVELPAALMAAALARLEES